MIVNLDLKNEIYQFAISKVGAQLEELLSKLKSLEEDKSIKIASDENERTRLNDQLLKMVASSSDIDVKTNAQIALYLNQENKEQGSKLAVKLLKSATDSTTRNTVVGELMRGTLSYTPELKNALDLSFLSMPAATELEESNYRSLGF